MDRFCFLCGDWTGRKYREISRKIGKNTDKYRNIGDIFEKLSKYPSTDNRWRISCRSRPISDISPKYRRNFSTFQSLVVLLVKKWLLIPNKLALFDLEGKLNYRTREDKLEGWVILKCLFWKISFHGQISVYMLWEPWLQ